MKTTAYTEEKVGITVKYADVVELKTEALDEDTLAVDDGEYRWLADRQTYEDTMSAYVERVRAGEDAEIDYYSDFCNLCKSLDRVNPARAEKAKALYLEIHGRQPNWV